MFRVLVKFKGQEPCVFGVPNSEYAKTLATMENVEWVLGPIAENGNLLLDGAAVDYSMLGETVIHAITPTVHVCENVVSQLALGDFVETLLKVRIEGGYHSDKIQLIKKFRDLTHSTLKDAKDGVETLLGVLDIRIGNERADAIRDSDEDYGSDYPYRDDYPDEPPF